MMKENRFWVFSFNNEQTFMLHLSDHFFLFKLPITNSVLA